MVLLSSRISSWSASHRDATARNAIFAAPDGVMTSPARRRAHVRARCSVVSAAQLGAQFVGCGVGEAVHLVRGRGPGFHRAGPGDP